MSPESIRESFARQSIMTTFGARLEAVEAGRVVVALPHQPHLVATARLSPCRGGHDHRRQCLRYAALSTMPEGSRCSRWNSRSTSWRLRRGELFLAEGRVVKAGRTLTITQGEVVAIEGERRTTVAIMTATMFRLDPR